jgi:PhoPQ-activated pathogenicity-related protein
VFVVVVLGGLGLFTYFGMALIERLSFPGKVAEIEQLRADVQRVTAAESEDVIGQVTQWNQEIASYQRYNRTWYADLLTPDGWDSVAMIVIPERAEHGGGGE